jgi:hypothetical protein
MSERDGSGAALCGAATSETQASAAKGKQDIIDLFIKPLRSSPATIGPNEAILLFRREAEIEKNSK